MHALGRIVLAAGLAGCASGSPAPPPTPAAAAAPPPAPTAAATPAPPPPPPLARAARLELTFTGDIMFGGVFHDHFSAVDTTSYDPLKEMAGAVASDLALANLETTVMASLPDDHAGHLRFVATPDQVASLPRNGFGAVTIANNHHDDFGARAVHDTPLLVGALGLQVIGAARLEPPTWKVETIVVKGWRIGFIAGATKRNRGQARGEPELPFAEPDKLTGAVVPVITAARADHDLVIVVLHWGEQYADAPGSWQVRAAHAFVDAGADAVIGHHPHVLQGLERYGRGLIAYSLGNFVFQNGEPRIRDTGVLRLGFRVDGACLDAVTFHPAIELRRPIYHPVPATGAALRELAARLIGLSAAKPLGTRMMLAGDHLTLAPACPPAP